MSYQTGTIANLNDVLKVLGDFLAANGWAVYGNWLEPVQTQILPTSDPAYFGRAWRFGRRLMASKGAVFIAAQDFFYTMDRSYGTYHSLGVGVFQGPGIAITIGTAFNDPGGFSAGNDAAHPVHGYDASGPLYAALDWIPLANPPIAPANGRVRTFIMPLPNLSAAPTGNYHPMEFVAGDPLYHYMGTNVGEEQLIAPFGTPGGAAKPMKYWLMCDATGDNVVMVVDRSGVNAAPVSDTPYLYFGDMSVTKGGAWVGGAYCGASLGCDAPFIFTFANANNASRWAPPGALRDDGSLPMVLRMTVDTFAGWVGLGKNTDTNIGTGRSLASSTLLVPKPADGNPNPLGTLDPGIVMNTLRLRRSSVGNGGPCLPTYWVVQRDNGNWSLAGLLPDVFQVQTLGIAAGQTGLAAAPDHEYLFRGDLSDSKGGPALVQAGVNIAPLATALDVDGFHTSYANGGLSLSGVLTAGGVYTIEMQFAVANLSPTWDAYGKILDFKNRTSDLGLYMWDPIPYPPSPGEPGDLAWLHDSTQDTSVGDPLSKALNRVLMTRNAAGRVQIYLNDKLVIEANDAVDLDGVFSGPGNIINFFLDDGFIGDLGNDAQEIPDAATIRSIRVWNRDLAAIGDVIYFDGFAVRRHT